MFTGSQEIKDTFTLMEKLLGMMQQNLTLLELETFGLATIKSIKDILHLCHLTERFIQRVL
jgi:hypothetical protein